MPCSCNRQNCPECMPGWGEYVRLNQIDRLQKENKTLRDGLDAQKKAESALARLSKEHEILTKLYRAMRDDRDTLLSMLNQVANEDDPAGVLARRLLNKFNQ